MRTAFTFSKINKKVPHFLSGKISHFLQFLSFDMTNLLTKLTIVLRLEGDNSIFYQSN